MIVQTYQELENACDQTFGLYRLPSKKVLDFIPEINTKDDDYDRWAHTFNYCHANFDKNFTIDSDVVLKKTYKSLAEIYHIAHVDKKIDSFIHVRKRGKITKVQPGIKRLLLLDVLPEHLVPIITFDFTVKGLEQYVTRNIDKNYNLTYTEIGYELQDKDWNNQLKEKISQEKIKVYVDRYKCVMNDIVFFERHAEKAKWRLVYK